MKGKPILEVREVTKTFGGIIALNRVSFDVDGGEILGFIGPTASGKTTVGKMLAKLQAGIGSS